jgi:hypothetical protein
MINGDLRWRDLKNSIKAKTLHWPMKCFKRNITASKITIYRYYSKEYRCLLGVPLPRATASGHPLYLLRASAGCRCCPSRGNVTK